MKVRLLLLLLLLLLTAFPAAAAEEVPVTVNGETVIQGRLLEGVTYVPLRAVSQALGAEDLTWDGETQTASLTLNGARTALTVGQEHFVQGRYTEPLGAPVRLVEGRTMVPLRDFATPFAFTVKWDGETRSVALYTDGSPEDDLYWMARIIQAESGLEPWEGKLAVGDVVRNRASNPGFPDSIHGVIFDDKFAIQFTPVLNGTVYLPPSRESILAAAACLRSTQLSDGVLYFLNPALSSSFWVPENRKYAFTIGGHDFYY